MNNQSQPVEKLNVPIRQFITKRLIGISIGASIQKSAARMAEFRISSLGILDNSSVIGIITDTDLKKALAEGKSSNDAVREIMTPDPVTADINSPVRDVLDLMSKNKIKHVFVTDEGEVVGVITRKELKDLDLQSMETYIAR